MTKPTGLPRKTRKTSKRSRVPVNYVKGVKSPEAQAAWDAGPKAWMDYVRSHKEFPGRRPGVPDGMRRAEADAMWKECSEKATLIMEKLEEAGVLHFEPTPDDQMAKKALHTAFEIAMSPIEMKNRITALRTVLEYTKARPAVKTDLRLNSAEAWLAEVISDHQAGQS